MRIPTYGGTAPDEEPVETPPEEMEKNIEALLAPEHRTPEHRQWMRDLFAKHDLPKT